MATIAPCSLCTTEVGTPVWRDALLRITRADETGFPAFYRVIWNAHITEFSDLTAAQRSYCTEAITVVEQALREHVAPIKINLASLGNMVPHLHWHVIARFKEDTHFPASVWAAPVRPRNPARETALLALLPPLEDQIKARMQALASLASAAAAS